MNILKKSAAECIATFILVFAGCGAIMVHSLFPESLSNDAIPAVFGLVVAAMIYTVGHVSGAHLNPAVTITFAITKRFAWKEVPHYIIAQMVGAFLAIAILSATLPASQTLGQTVPSVAILPALIWEIILTYILMFVIMSVATDSRAVGITAGIAIGATVALDAFIGGAITGASMNPARSLAPAMLSGQLSHVWIYVVGPCVGAILGALSYEWVRCDLHSNKQDASGCC